MKNLCSGTQCEGFKFLLILDLWGISFHAVIVLGLGKDLLFKSVLGRCVVLENNNATKYQYMKKVASKQSFSLSRSYMTNPSNQHESSHDIGKKTRKRNWKPFHAICHQVTMTFFPRNNFYWEKYGSQRFLQTQPNK